MNLSQSNKYSSHSRNTEPDKQCLPQPPQRTLKEEADLLRLAEGAIVVDAPEGRGSVDGGGLAGGVVGGGVGGVIQGVGCLLLHPQEDGGG